MEILGLTKKERTAVRVIVPEYFHSENTWTEGEVPWNITDDNDTIPVTAKVPTFDPLEPCSIGHLFI
uniref:Uncharacterized protein n=1 Tax=viral metagenome TaxID=1070528 RepID=A0A6C0D699_9ZZZZ